MAQSYHTSGTWPLGWSAMQECMGWFRGREDEGGGMGCVGSPAPACKGLTLWAHGSFFLNPRVSSAPCMVVRLTHIPRHVILPSLKRHVVW